MAGEQTGGLEPTLDLQPRLSRIGFISWSAITDARCPAQGGYKGCPWSRRRDHLDMVNLSGKPYGVKYYILLMKTKSGSVSLRTSLIKHN